MKRPSYRFGVEWIAMNDDPEEIDPHLIRQQMSVALLADLFGKTQDEVAMAIYKLRTKGIR